MELYIDCLLAAIINFSVASNKFLEDLFRKDIYNKNVSPYRKGEFIYFAERQIHCNTLTITLPQVFPLNLKMILTLSPDHCFTHFMHQTSFFICLIISNLNSLLSSNSISHLFRCFKSEILVYFFISSMIIHFLFHEPISRSNHRFSH